MVSSPIKAGNAKLTLSVNKRVLEKYKKHCNKNGKIISKQIETFMEGQLKDEKD